MVQITHARILDPKTGKTLIDDPVTKKPVTISAKKYDKVTDKDKICACPDENCPARLTHYKEYDQTFYDLVTGEAFTLKIPAHYKRMAGSPPHAKDCTAVDQYTIYQNYSRSVGGQSLQNGAFIYNLNIITDTNPAPIRRPKTQSPAFNYPAGILEPEPRKREKRPPLSQGLSDAKELAGLLNKTEFDREHRDNIILRAGREKYTLAELFEDDTLALFRREHERAKKGLPRRPVLFQFRPIALPMHHDKWGLTIKGDAKPVRGSDHKEYWVAVRLRCENRHVFDAVMEEIKQDRRDPRKNHRSFLVYASEAVVDLHDFAIKKQATPRIEEKKQSKSLREIQTAFNNKKEKEKDLTLYVDLKIATPQQVAAWSPFTGQLDLEQTGLLDLPLVEPPRKKIPRHLQPA